MENETLTEVIRDQIGHGKMSRMAEVASALGKNYQVFANEVQPNNSSHKLGADVVLPVMKILDSDVPLHWLAAQRGGVFIKLPAAKTGLSSIQRKSLLAVKEFGEFAASVADGIQDGNLEPDEVERILKEGQEALTGIQVVMEMAKQMEAA